MSLCVPIMIHQICDMGEMIIDLTSQSYCTYMIIMCNVYVYM